MTDRWPDDPLSGRLYLSADLTPWERSVPVFTPDEVVFPTAKPVQRKVAASSVGTYVGSLLLVALVQGLQDGSILTFLPPTVAALVAPIIPAVLTFVVGYTTTNKVSADDAKALAAAVEKRISEVAQEKVAAAIDAAFPARTETIETGEVQS